MIFSVRAHLTLCLLWTNQHVVSEERSNLPTTQSELGPYDDPVGGVAVAHDDSSAIDSAWMSISDFFSSTAEDFFSIDMDFLQDDFFRFAG